LRKATISFVISVRLSVLMAQLSSHCAYFYISYNFSKIC
jgi:hypothetical protein